MDYQLLARAVCFSSTGKKLYLDLSLHSHSGLAGNFGGHVRGREDIMPATVHD